MIELGRGVTLVDDSYNSSPAALSRALDALAATAPDRRRVAALGEMRELGDLSIALHEESGRRAVAAGVDRLIAVGGDAGERARRRRDRSGADARARVATSRPAPRRRTPSPRCCRAGDVVLVKGSRGTRMDIVADRVKQEWA